jgi:hypothetical protein
MSERGIGTESAQDRDAERLACAMYQAFKRSSRSSASSLSQGALVSGDALSRQTTIDGTFDLVKVAAKVLTKLKA